MTPTAAPVAAWTCPFCPLACDHLTVRGGHAGEPLVLQGGTCERASRSLGRFQARDDVAVAEVDGKATALAAAIAAAAQLLGASRQPLFAGLGTDVAGARALYPLACAAGAICDSAGGDSLMQGLRALQDRGQFTTTLAEVRTRADVIVFIGGLPLNEAPLIAQRCGIGETQVVQRHVVLLGPAGGDETVLAQWAGPGVSVEAVPLVGDLFTTLSLLVGLLAPDAPGAWPNAPAGTEALRALAARLRAARYGVLVGAPSRLPPHGALIIEAVHQAVGHLNRDTRAAALWLGGGNGAATANQVFTWLSGVPLRSRAGPRGLDHEPFLFDTQRLLADAAVDALLWVSCFDPDAVPPPTDVPMLVLGPPALAPSCRRSGAVFIGVSTPGIDSDGHVFRTDGTVLMPLNALVRDALPSLAEVAGGILKALQARRAA
jgi:formylmethanofuran dehydrogenase subunit B